jgi:outer membrane protein
MIKKFVLLFTMFTILAASGSAFAQGMKIGTVDMDKIFNEYYKTKQARERLKEVEEQAKTELDDRMDFYKGVLEEIKQIEQEARNEALSEEARSEAETKFQEKAREARSLEQEITEFRQTRQRQIREQIMRMRRGLIREIIEVIDEEVKAQNYDLVFDKSGPSAAGYPLVVYSRPGLEFTDQIIEKINEDAGTATAEATTEG